MVEKHLLQNLQQQGNDSKTPQSRAPFLEALKAIAPPILEGGKEQYFFPGHGGGKHIPTDFADLSAVSPWQFDVPELDGLDNIHNPEGPLLEALQLAAKLFGAKRSWFLVNGSTSGILIAIFSCIRVWCSTAGTQRVEEADKPLVFLVARDCHKSVFDALALSGRCDAVLLPCDMDEEFQVPLGVRIAAVREAVAQFEGRVCGLVLTRPSYQGVLAHGSAIAEMVELCHKHRIPGINNKKLIQFIMYYLL
jgi:arginine/lysine/ornithine decarboxylase